MGVLAQSIKIFGVGGVVFVFRNAPDAVADIRESTV
jgi:hypothetical protein